MLRYTTTYCRWLELLFKIVHFGQIFSRRLSCAGLYMDNKELSLSNHDVQILSVSSYTQEFHFICKYSSCLLNTL